MRHIIGRLWRGEVGRAVFGRVASKMFESTAKKKVSIGLGISLRVLVRGGETPEYLTYS